MDTSLTLTTINMPHVIENILENAGESETENLQIKIIGDLKTPIEIEDYVKRIDKSSKAEIVYLSVADQENFFQSILTCGIIYLLIHLLEEIMLICMLLNRGIKNHKN